MKKLIALVFLFGCGTAQAATLVGMGELFEPGDLTVIERDDGLFAEYLDLNLTAGWTKQAALDAYQGYGFSVASVDDVSQLFDAFGFSYVFTPGTYTELPDADGAERQLFVDYLGKTGVDETAYNSLAAYNNPLELYSFSYFCVSTTGCGPLAFTNEIVSSRQLQIGITLVRTSAVPIPAAVWLFGAALVGLGWFRRKKA
jgi:hypothetical protein